MAETTTSSDVRTSATGSAREAKKLINSSGVSESP